MINSDISRDHKNQLAVVLLIVFFGFVGVSIPYPIFAPLFLHSSELIIENNWMLANKNLLLGITLAMYPIGQFIGSPIIGELSDVFGRKPILIYSLAVSIIGYIISGLALHSHSFYLLISSRFITGCAEGNLAIARAIAADLNSISKYKSFGKISAFSSFGYVVGPIIGGVLSNASLAPYFNYSLPFYFASLLIMITTILAYIYIDESNVSRKGKVCSLCSVTLRIFKFKIFGRRLNKKLKRLLLVSTALTLGVDTFYEFNPAFLTVKWGMLPIEISIYNAVLSTAIFIGCGWLALYLSKINKNNFFVNISIISFILMLFSMLLTKTSSILPFSFIIIGLTIAISLTFLSVQISDSAEGEIQGEVMGIMSGLRMLGDGLICLFGGILLSFSINIPFITCILFGLIAFFLYYTSR